MTEHIKLLKEAHIVIRNLLRPYNPEGILSDIEAYLRKTAYYPHPAGCRLGGCDVCAARKALRNLGLEGGGDKEDALYMDSYNRDGVRARVFCSTDRWGDDAPAMQAAIDFTNTGKLSRPPMDWDKAHGILCYYWVRDGGQGAPVDHLIGRWVCEKPRTRELYESIMELEK